MIDPIFNYYNLFISFYYYYMTESFEIYLFRISVQNLLLPKSEDINTSELLKILERKDLKKNL